MILLAPLWKTSLGKKVVMAVTGAILLLFVVGHLVGNLQIYIPDGGVKINAYGRLLHSNLALLWTVRTVMMGCVLLHLIAATALTIQNWKARPVGYARKSWREADYAARTMVIGGPIIALFVVGHLLHFTTGQVHPDFKLQAEVAGAAPHLPDVHHNVVTGLQDPLPAALYVVALVMLGLHLFHGGWSLFQSLGINHPKWTPVIKGLMGALAVFVTAGNLSIPVCVFLGLVR